MSSKKSGKRKKNRAGLIAAAVLIIIIIAGAAIWYTSGIKYKLRSAGYSSEEITKIQTLFTEDEQEVLASRKAQSGIIDIAEGGRYQEDHLQDYLDGLEEGKDILTLEDEYDPWIIALRAAEGYREEELDTYLRVYPNGTADKAAEVVAYINRGLDFMKMDGYQASLSEEYEAYYKKHPEMSLQDIVTFVNTAQDYADQSYFIESYLDRYEAYRAEHSDIDLEEVVRCVNAGIDKPFYTGVQPADMSKGYLVLVNKYNNVEKDYEPELEELTGYGYGSLEKTAAEWFKKMVDAARADGIYLKSVSPFRTWNIQSIFYYGYVNQAGTAEADTYSARPGFSEHETGLAVDINTASISTHFENTAEYEWLINNCWKYGFILRYLPDKQYLTGYVYEPWHYRYVGTEYAKEIMDLGITFEEYYAFYVNNPDKK